MLTRGFKIFIPILINENHWIFISNKLEDKELIITMYDSMLEMCKLTPSWP